MTTLPAQQFLTTISTGDLHRQRALRVLYVDHTAKLSGGEIALLNLLRQVEPLKVQPIVLLFSSGPLVALLSESSIETHLLEMDTTVLETRKNTLGINSIFKFKQIQQVFLQVAKVVGFIRKHDIDIVHTNSLKADVIAGIAAKIAGVPLIWHIRDRIDGDYLPGSIASVFKLAAKLIPDVVIANSKATLSALNSTGSSFGATTVVVHDGTPLANELANKKSNPSQVRNTTVGIIGRISPWKGQHIFLQAAQMVHRHFPETRFKIVGSALFDEQEYEAEIRKLCTDLGLEQVVEFTGFREDIANVLDELDIVVHASTTGEPFGQVIVEAMSAGKPIVATNGGGVPEIVQDEVVGRLVPMNDPDATAKALMDLIADAAYSSRLGEAGRQHVLKNFTIEQTARGIEKVYEYLALHDKRLSV